jgi:CRISPR-associated protein Cmr4
MNAAHFETKTYYALALDPVHVGAGGYRLGHVDNTILRDPPTGLPKIPGSSLSGVARAYLAMELDKLKCAGKGGQTGDEHCGSKNCEVCVTFGFSKGNAQKSLHGMAQFFDAQILFFPVQSLAGPVWLTSPSALQAAGANLTSPIEDGKALTSPGLPVTWEGRKSISLGWLFLEANDSLQINQIAPANLPRTNSTVKMMLSRLVVVSDAYFTHLVNDNLEVRTSVAIDPRTGAAEEKALFTFEAMPRATLLHFDCAFNNPAHFVASDEPIEKDLAWVKTSVEKGFAHFAHLGVGGMNTRGMGRLKILNLES